MSKPINKNTMEICKDIDLPKLKEFLEKLGWSIRDYGYGHFRIFNEYGKPTQWVFYRGILELDDIGEFQPFGKTPEDYIHNGHFHLDLKEFNLELTIDDKVGRYDMLSIVHKKIDNNNLFISFYNTKKD